MRSECPRTVQSRLEVLFNDGNIAALTDAQLLDRFVARGEEPAFEALVLRHGGMVFQVCRALLDNRHDAEDAMQATFLVLARKAASLRDPELLGCWLHGVAHQVARKSRSRVTLRRRREREVGLAGERDPASERQGNALIAHEENAILHEEIARLPEHYRVSVVLHYLEGRTHDEIARRLRRPLGTVSARISRARDLLRSRLARRGVAPAAVLTSLGFSETAAALSAELLRSTAQAACRFAAGSVSPSPSVLAANAVLRHSFWMPILKLATCAAILTVAAVGLSAQRAPAADEQAPGQPPAQSGTPSARTETPPVAPSAPAVDAKVRGRVLDPDGKPLANANVAIVTTANVPRGGPLARTVIPAQATTDSAGRFELTPPSPIPGDLARRYVHAAAPGFAFARAVLSPGAATPETLELRLSPEQPIPIRLIDLEGKPVAGVSIRVVSLLDAPPTPITARQRYAEPPLEAAAVWPGPFLSDNDGRSTLRGLGRSMGAIVEVADDRFARERLTVGTGDGPQPAIVTLALAPGRKLAGHVLDSETGRPIAGATVILQAAQASQGAAEVRSDAGGAFSLVVPPGDRSSLFAFAPTESSYLPLRMTVSATRELGRPVDVKLTRGAIVRGRVIEALTNKPVAGVAIEYRQQQVNNPYFRGDLSVAIGTGLGNALSGPDGTFSLILPPGPGTLLAKASSKDYITIETNDGLLRRGEPGGIRLYPHAIAGLSAKPSASRDPKADQPIGEANVEQVEMTLRRGIVLDARVVDTAGAPVADAVLVCPTGLAVGLHNGQQSQPIRDGLLRIPGQDPNQPVTVYILDREHALGARAELRVKASGEPPVVRLEPCGSARVRFLNEHGEPVAGRPFFADGVMMTLELIVEPGVPRVPPSNKLEASTVYAVNLDRPRHKALRTDDEGRVTFPALIPGATYRALAVEGRASGYVDFTVSAGQTTEVGDVIMKPTESQ